MRVAFLLDRWDPKRGGSEYACAALADRLVASGHEVCVCAAQARGELPGRWHPARPGWGTRAQRERRLGHALVELGRQARADVTIGIRHLPEVDLYWPHHGSLQGEDEARVRRGAAPKRRGGHHAVFREFEENLLARDGARRVLCVSDAVRAELLRFYPGCAERLEVVPNGVDLQRFRPLPDDERRAVRARLGLRAVASETPLIAFVGNDPFSKGLGELLAALARCAALPWTLVAAGTFRVAPWRRRAQRLGLAERVRFPGRVDGAQLLASADLTVVPTWRDTSLLVVLESLACGTPMITSRHAGEAGLLADERYGSVVAEPGDPDELAGALRTWLGRVFSVSPGLLRAQVQDRGLEAWLARLEGCVEDSAQSERRSWGPSSSSGSSARR